MKGIIGRMGSWAGAACLALGLVTAPSLRAATAREPADTIARVGDQIIRFSDIERMINSSTMVGIGLPPPGTRERNTLRITLLDKAISANLLYLDALDQKVDQRPAFRRDVQRFAEAMMRSIYRQKYLIGEIRVSDEEVLDYFHKHMDKDTPFTSTLGEAIRARLRKARYLERQRQLRRLIRAGVEVSIEMDQLDPAGDDARPDDAVVARYASDGKVTWKALRAALAGKKADDVSARVRILDRLIDDRLLLMHARAAGIEKDPLYRARVDEFRKVRLINLHRTELVQRMQPTDAEVRAFYREHRKEIMLPEARKIQMVVLRTRKEAEEIKRRIESGELTLYQAARDYSIDPNAKKTLGEMGWVAKGTGFPELDRFTFSLEKGVLGGPVHSPAGWHLVKVLDIRPAAFDDIEDPATFRKARRLLIHRRLAAYVVELRKKKYPVTVYEDRLRRFLEEDLQKGKQQEATGAAAAS
ncbi:MAG: hypothetical protein D6721_08280 [Gammaproteobacteria bacterium]|nr:MAG: hypothetical protein D6721_08280 [Gammaproteobacteria bacterium]